MLTRSQSNLNEILIIAGQKPKSFSKSPLKSSKPTPKPSPSVDSPVNPQDVDETSKKTDETPLEPQKNVGPLGKFVSKLPEPVRNVLPTVSAAASGYAGGKLGQKFGSKIGEMMFGKTGEFLGGMLGYALGGSVISKPVFNFMHNLMQSPKGADAEVPDAEVPTQEVTPAEKAEINTLLQELVGLLAEKGTSEEDQVKIAKSLEKLPPDQLIEKLKEHIDALKEPDT